jgi:hypothetical protein
MYRFMLKAFGSLLGANPAKRMSIILIALVLLGLSLLFGQANVSDGLDLFREFGSIGLPV